MKRNPRRPYETALMPLSNMREHGVSRVGADAGGRCWVASGMSVAA